MYGAYFTHVWLVEFDGKCRPSGSCVHVHYWQTNINVTLFQTAGDVHHDEVLKTLDNAGSPCNILKAF